MPEESNSQLAFLDFKQFADESVRTGLLVSDFQTRPLEFLVTSPVKPTSMQKILYGKVLRHTVFNDLMGLPLLEKSAQSIAIVLVKNAGFLNLRPKVPFPVALVHGNTSVAPDDADRDRVFRSLRIELHHDFETEREFVTETIKRTVVDLGVDIWEPFERVQLALNEVHAFKPEKPST